MNEMDRPPRSRLSRLSAVVPRDTDVWKRITLVCASLWLVLGILMSAVQLVGSAVRWLAGWF